MPDVDAQRSPDASVVTFAPRGPLTRARILNTVERHYPSLGDAHIIWDLRDADLSGLSQQDFIAIALTAKNILTRGSGRRTAYLVRTAQDYVLLCKYVNEAFHGRLPAEYSIFRTPEEATQWFRGR